MPTLIVFGFVIAIAAMTAVSIGVAESKTNGRGKAERPATVDRSPKGRALGLQRERGPKGGVLVVKKNRHTTTTVPTSTTSSEPVSSTTTTSGSSSTTTPTSNSSSTTGSTVGSTLVPTTSAPASTTITNVPTTVAPSTTQRATTTTTQRSTTTTKSSGAGEWYEGFDSLNTSRWVPEHSTYGDGNGERQCYQPNNVSVQGGKLVLRAAEESVTCPGGVTRTISSGMVRSRGLSFSPGQAIEFRVKLTVGDSSNQAGLWPAVWSSSWAGGGWPVGGELDFLEVMTAEDPNRAMFSMHFADESGRHRLQNRPAYLNSPFSDDWHTIRFDYGFGGRLKWYLDGREVFAADSASTRQGYPAPFDQTIPEIKVNMAVGGSPGGLGSGVLSKDATFEVDYIRVFNL